MDSELSRYLFVQDILAISDNFEFKSVIERFLISMANLKIADRKDPILADISIDNPIYQKMASELLEKGIVENVDSSVEFIEIIRNMITKFLSLEGDTSDFSPDDLKFNGKGKISYKGVSVSIPQERIDLLLDISEGDEEAVAKVVFRYQGLALGSQQWSVPKIVYEDLYRNWGVRLEAFTSPLNSQLLNFPETEICSLFPDTDAVFRSIGNFFDVSIDGKTLVANPPFIETVLEACVRKVLDAKDYLAFVVMPHWTDMEAYRLVESDAKVFHVLDKYKHYYTDVSKGHHVKAKFRSVVAVFTDRDDVEITKKDLRVFNKNPLPKKRGSWKHRNN